MTKTLIAIVTCAAYREKLQDQLDTWVPLLRARGFDVQAFDGERLGVPDDYLSLPLKVRALCRYAVEHGYSRLLKIDDDTYINHELFQAVTAYDYAGVRRKAHNSGSLDGRYTAPLCINDYAQGGAYWLSRKAFSLVATAEPDDWAEDRWVGRVLANNGIELTELSEYVIVPESLKRFHAAVLTQLPKSGMRSYHRQILSSERSYYVKDGEIEEGISTTIPLSDFLQILKSTAQETTLKDGALTFRF